MTRSTILSVTCVLSCIAGCSKPESNAEPAQAPASAPDAASVSEEAKPSELAPAPEAAAADDADAAGGAAPGAAPSPAADFKAKDSTRETDAIAEPFGADRPEPIIQGNLDRDIIRRVVRKNGNAVKACFDAGLSSNASLRGTVTIDFQIDANGKVQAASAAEGFEDPKVAKCIADAVADWEFPAPDDGEVRVSYPFVLEP